MKCVKFRWTTVLATCLHLVKNKHFIAIKSGLAIIIGENSGGVKDYCTVDSIEYTPDGITLLAELSAGGMNDEIKACSGCATCGS